MAPVFFVRKKDLEELRPVMDYQELNQWMQRDNNPLLNIRTVLKNLQEGDDINKKVMNMEATKREEEWVRE